MPAADIHLRTCPLCEAMCGLRFEVEAGRVTRVRPDPDDVWSHGYSCPKGIALGELHHDPDRLQRPLVRDRDTGEFREVDWDTALETAWQRLKPVLDTYGKEGVTAYIGNPTAHNFSLGRYIGAFVGMGGLSRIYSAGTVDQWPKNVVGAILYGGMWTIPTPDLDRTDHLLILGANPHASQGSLMAAADVMSRLRAIQKRGGRIVVVDPRRTGTAERADAWVPIRPGTDAALLFAMVQVLFAEGLVSLGRLEKWVSGVDEVERLAQPFTPEAVAETCGIPAQTIRDMTLELAAAERAAVYGRIGTCTQEFGTLASWLVEVLNVLTGNLDRPGGSMFANPVAFPLASLRPPEFAEGFSFGRWRSRVRGAPEVLGQVPVSCLAEEIATPGEGQPHALITIAGNPVVSAPDATRLDAALSTLSCMISVDNYLNETTRHADVILPGLSPLEQPHCDDLIWMWSVRNAIRYSPAVFPHDEGRPEEWETLLTLAAMLNGAPPSNIDTAQLDDLYFAGLVATLTQTPSSRIAGRNPAEIVAATPGRGPERILDLSLRIGPWGDGYGADPDGLTRERLVEARHGLDRGALTPRLPEILETPSGRIELVHEHLRADVPRLRERLRRANPSLVLVSRRHLRSNNSWMHNLPSLMTGRDRCTLLVHPEDADRFGLANGEPARITSKAGSAVAPVEVTSEMTPGVVCLPHGWGHDKDGARLRVAARHPGVNNNVLAPGELVDPPSGNQVVNGIPVEVAPQP